MTLSHHTTKRRKGAVLLVVLAMLALFAVIGLSFVFYAESRATSARIYREAQAPADVPNALQAAMPAFSQLIYDTNDGPTGVFSGLRGHSLARGLYGAYYDGSPLTPSYIDTGTNPWNVNPYNGVGLVPTSILGPNNLPVVHFGWQFGTTLYDPERSLSRTDPAAALNANSRYIGKNVSSTYVGPNDMAIAMVNPVNGNVLVPSLHCPWVFNNSAYAATPANDFVRQLALAPPGTSGKPISTDGNEDWLNVNNNFGRYRIIRPRPIDHAGTFPYPPPNADGTYTGDVQNLPGAAYPYLLPNGSIAVDAQNNPILIPKNDSLWVDIGAPVQIWNGKQIKPLFAFLIMPTNNKVNINSAGNPRGPNNDHDSGMGLFPAEVNPKYVLNSANSLNEFQKLKYQAFNSTVAQPTAYNVAATQNYLPAPQGIAPLVPNTQSALFPKTLNPSVYAPFDWDATGPVNAMRMQMPGQQTVSTNVGNSAFATAPRWTGPVTMNRYGNGDLGDALSTPTSPLEQLFSPYLWNPYFWKSQLSLGRVYTESDLRKLHTKWADDVGLTNSTSLGNLIPISLGAQSGIPGISTSPGRSVANAARMSITTRSNSLAIPSFMPLTAATPMAPNTYNWPAAVAPALPWSTSPTAAIATTQNPATGTYTLPSTGSDFPVSGTNVLMRGYYGNLPPLDLNRKLADYRHALAVRYNLPLRPDNMISPTNAADYTNWFTNNMGVAPTAAQTTADAPLLATAATQAASLYAAMQDRQEFARDIFARLVIATGASATYNPSTGYCVPNAGVTVGTPEFDALRYLAQLAANIVDYIDGDDVSTLFVWNPDPTNLATVQPHLDPLNTASAVAGQRTVFGVEKPKLVLNEAYLELTNNEADVGNTANQPLELRFFLELMNPSPNDLAYGNEAKPYSNAATPTTNPSQNAWLYYSLSEQTPTPADPRYNPTGVPYSSYVVDAYKDGSTFNSTLTARVNVLSQSAVAPDFRVDFANVASVAATTPPTPQSAQAGYAGAAVRTNPAFGPSPKVVAPVGTKYLPDIMQIPSPPGAANPVAQGYLVMLPGGKSGSNPTKEFSPVPFAAAPAPGQYNPSAPQYQYAMMVPPATGGVSPPTQLEIAIGGARPNDTQINTQLNNLRTNPPTIAVRRLANPYLRPNDPTIPAGAFAYDATLPLNPYLVVDTMMNSNINDGVRNAFATPVTNHAQTPMDQRHSWVKANPLTASVGQVGPPSVEFPAMGFCRQYQKTPTPGAVNESFFRHNGLSLTDPETPTPVASATATRTAVGPFGSMTADPNLYMPDQGNNRGGFDWMVFMDRPLVNQLELLHVPAVPPHLLTMAFGSNIAGTPTMHTHVAQWNNQSRLYRALELLQVKPWTYATPIGGRVPGKININMVTDPNVLLALADPQSGDFFLSYQGTTDPQTGLTLDAIYDQGNPLNPATTYGKLMTARGASAPQPILSNQYNPATGATVATQLPGPNDRPFRGLTNTATTTGYLPQTNGINDTVLNGVFDLPSQKHPYAKGSLARKIMNNLTTTSDTFEVYMTVGFFEVLNSGPFYSTPNYTIPQLGKEVYKDVEGDMRTRFYAVVDRTNLSIDLTNKTVQGSRPIMTELAATMPGLAAAGNSSMSIYATGYTGGVAGSPATTIVNPSSITLQYEMSPSDPSPYQIIPGTTALRINTGSAEELVTVTAITSFDTLTGIATFTVNRTAPQFGITHRAGVRVMNGDSVLGNPGPQPNFDPNQAKYRAVMPYFIRLDGN